MGNPSEVQCLMRIADELTKIRKILEERKKEETNETVAQGSNTISTE